MQEKKIVLTPLQFTDILRRTLECDRYILRHKSYLSYRSILYRFLSWKLQNYELPNSAYLEHMLKQGTSPRTAHNNLTTLRTFLNKAKQLDHNIENDLQRFRKLPYTSRSPMVFSEEQLRILRVYLEALKPHFWVACSLQYYCYIRPNELRYLQVRDVDLVRHKIFISHTYAKNKKDEFVSIPKPLRPLLGYLRLENPNYYLFGNNSEFKPSKQLASRDKLSRYFTKVLRTLGIEGRYSFYSLKHTGVERAVRAGVNIKEIQVQLRHHSLDMVNEYLKNLGAFELKDIDDKFPPIA